MADAQQKGMRPVKRTRFRRADEALWASANPTLEYGEPGYVRETRTLKVGDGVTPWNDLSAVVGDSSESSLSFPAGLASLTAASGWVGSGADLVYDPEDPNSSYYQYYNPVIDSGDVWDDGGIWMEEDGHLIVTRSCLVYIYMHGSFTVTSTVSGPIPSDSLDLNIYVSEDGQDPDVQNAGNSVNMQKISFKYLSPDAWDVGDPAVSATSDYFGPLQYQPKLVALKRNARLTPSIYFGAASAGLVHTQYVEIDAVPVLYLEN